MVEVQRGSWLQETWAEGFGDLSRASRGRRFVDEVPVDSAWVLRRPSQYQEGIRLFHRLLAYAFLVVLLGYQITFGFLIVDEIPFTRLMKPNLKAG